MRGHLQCRDTLAGNQGCPLKTGTTVLDMTHVPYVPDIINWTMESVMLACKRFTGRHRAENIRQQYEETVASFDIAEKITNIVTDNASNMTKASALIYLGSMVLLKTQRVTMMVRAMMRTRNPTRAATNYSRPRSVMPALCMNDGLQKVVGHASKIVAYVRKSVNGTEAIATEKHLQPAVTTRWNSQLVMIKSG